MVAVKHHMVLYRHLKKGLGHDLISINLLCCSQKIS